MTAGTPSSEEGTGVARGSPDPRGYLWRSIVGSLNTCPGPLKPPQTWEGAGAGRQPRVADAQVGMSWSLLSVALGLW